MNNNRIIAFLVPRLPHLLLVGLGGLLSYLFDKDKDDVTQILSSFVEVGALFSSFTVVVLSFFLSYEGNWIKSIKNKGLFPALIYAMKGALLSFAALLVTSILGFFEAAFIYASFFILGLSIGYYMNVFLLLVSVGEREGEEIKQSKEEVTSEKKPLASASYYEEVEDLLKGRRDTVLETDDKKESVEEILKPPPTDSKPD